MIGNPNDKTNFPHKLLLINREVANLSKAFPYYLSTDIKLLRTQLSKMIQSRGFLGRNLGALLKTGLLLMKNVIQPLAKGLLIALGLTAAVSVADAGIHKKILRTVVTTIIISNDEMESIMKIVKFLENSGLLWKRISETIQNEAKKQKGGFLSMLLGLLVASLTGNISR